MRRFRIAVSLALTILTLGGAAAGAQPRQPAGRDLTVERVGGRCGENALGEAAQRATTTVTARATRRGVVVQVRNFRFNCAQILGFAARIDGRTVTLSPRSMGGGTASCTCLHESRILVKGVAPGDYEIRVATGEQRTVLGPGGRGLVSEPVFVTGRVNVP